MPVSGSACVEKAAPQRKGFWPWSARPARDGKPGGQDGRSLLTAASRVDGVAADVRSVTDPPEQDASFADSATLTELARLRVRCADPHQPTPEDS